MLLPPGPYITPYSKISTMRWKIKKRNGCWSVDFSNSPCFQTSVDHDTLDEALGFIQNVTRYYLNDYIPYRFDFLTMTKMSEQAIRDLVLFMMAVTGLREIKTVDRVLIFRYNDDTDEFIVTDLIPD